MVKFTIFAQVCWWRDELGNSGHEALLRKVGGMLDILGQVHTSQVCWFQYRVQVRHGRVTSSTAIRAAVKLAG